MLFFQGFVPGAHLAKTPIDKPADKFYIGQSVTCRVLSCDPAQDKLALSFILEGDAPAASNRKRKISQTSTEESDKTESVDKRSREEGKVTAVGKPLSLGQVSDSDMTEIWLCYVLCVMCYVWVSVMT